MPALKRALKELESATTAVATADIEDFAEVKAAMDRRHWAIADVAELVKDPLAFSGEDRADAFRRLRLAMENGARAEERITRARGAAVAEWTQWRRIYRSLGLAGTSKSSRIDCRG